MAAIQAHLLKNEELKNFFQKFFGSSVKNAYICRTMENGDSIDSILKSSEWVSRAFSELDSFMEFDPGCDFVLEFSDSTWVEISPAQPSYAMTFTVFDVRDAILVD